MTSVCLLNDHSDSWNVQYGTQTPGMYNMAQVVFNLVESYGNSISWNISPLRLILNILFASPAYYMQY